MLKEQFHLLYKDDSTFRRKMRKKTPYDLPVLNEAYLVEPSLYKV
jgi:hypothetical protein